jgi:hypothetical protein
MSHLPVVIVEPKAWLAWRLVDVAGKVHQLATRLCDDIPEDPVANAVAMYLDYEALKAPEVVTPGPRVQRYMTTGGPPAA